MKHSPRVITSRANPQYKAAKLARKASATHPFFPVEGEKLIGEALRVNWQPRELWYVEKQPFKAACPLYRIPESLYQGISPTKTNRGPLALFEAKPLQEPPPATTTPAGDLLLADQIQDPGNAGALVRAAAAFGLNGVLWHAPCAFPYHHACIRASAGAVFHLHHYRASSVWLEGAAPRLVGTDTWGTQLEAFAWPSNSIVVMGNEGKGLSQMVNKLVTQRVTIPISAMTESLNVAGAAHILLYQLNRYRIKNIQNQTIKQG